MTTPRHLTRLLLTHPDHLRAKDTTLLASLTTACPEMNHLASLIGEFAQLPAPADGDDAELTQWITAVRTTGLPHPHSFCNGSNSTAPP